MRVQSESNLAVRYALPEEVVDVEEVSRYQPPGPSGIDWRKFGATRKRGVAAQLERDVHLVEQGEMLYGSTLAWAVAWVQYRLPTEGLEVVHGSECRALCDLDSAVPEQAEQLALAKSRYNEVPTILVFVHSEGPEHWSLLRRVRTVSGAYDVEYYDSLGVPSVSAMSTVRRLLRQLEWGEECPPPVNARKQKGGWECGLFALKFFEEGVRVHRGEFPERGPVKLGVMTKDINELITKVRKFLPESPAKPAESVPESVPEATLPLPAVESAAPFGVPVPVAAEPPPAESLAAHEGRVGVPPECEELTMEQAQAAAKLHSKCRGEGCAECMGKWFLPKVQTKSMKLLASESQPPEESQPVVQYDAESGRIHFSC